MIANVTPDTMIRLLWNIVILLSLSLFACVENYFLGQSAFASVPNSFRLSIFLPFSLR
jgi:hypothetical protein